MSELWEEQADPLGFKSMWRNDLRSRAAFWYATGYRRGEKGWPNIWIPNREDTIEIQEHLENAYKQGYRDGTADGE